MSIIKIAVQIILIGLASFGIGALIECYKKTIRKDKAKAWENKVIAGVLSIITALAFKFTGAFTPVLSAIFANLNVYLDVALYAVIIFLCQFAFGMKALKIAIKFALNNLPKDSDLETEITSILGKFKETTGVSADVVISILKAIGVSEDKIKSDLKELGLNEEQIESVTKKIV